MSVRFFEPQKQPSQESLKPLFKGSKGHVKLLDSNPALAKRVWRCQEHKASEILPGVFSSDPRYLAAMIDMYDELSKPEWQPRVSSDGSSINYLPGGESRLLSLSVWKKLPSGVGIDDNTSIREALTNVRDVSSLEVAIGDAVSKCFWSKRVSKSVSFRKEASTGFPDFKIGTVPKFEMVKLMHNVISSARAKGTKRLTASYLTKQAIHFIHVIGYRIQPDPSGKVRFSNTGVDIVKIDSSTPYSGHHGMRVRTVYGASGVYSYFLTALFGQFRHAYLSEYGFTYKHRTVREQEAKLDSFPSWRGVDVTQFDQTVPESILKLFVDGLKYTGYDQLIIDLVALGLGAPSVSNCPYHTSSPGEWSAPGDPFDDDSYSMNKGLPSGHPLNPDIGKFAMSVESISRFLRVSNLADGFLKLSAEDQFTRVREIMLGKNESFGFLNSADDNLWLSNDDEMLKKMLSTNGVFSIDVEAVPTFLGNIYGREGRYTKGRPNVMSSLVNWYVPERSLSTKPYHQTAWDERNAYHGAHFAAPILKQIAEKAFIKHFNASPDTMISARPQQPLPVALVTEVDRLFFLNPDVIHYRISSDDVNPQLITSVSATLPEEVVNMLCDSHGAVGVSDGIL